MIIFKNVRFKNFLSFGNQWTAVNFLTARKTIVLGSNGQGKSALIDVLVFALFGKPFRKINKGGLINSINKKELLVELEFSIKDNNYKIVRGMAPGIFDIFKNGVLVPQDASNRDYQKYLENDIINLNYRTFTQIVILGSSSYVQFMKLSTSAKREIIEDILDISVFSRMNELLKVDVKESGTSLKLLEKDKELHKSQYSFMFDKSKITDDSKQQRISSKKEEITRLEVEKLEKEGSKALTGDKTNQVEDEKPVRNRKVKMVEYRVGINNNLKQVGSEIEFYDENDTCPRCKKDLDDKFKDERVALLMDKQGEFTKALDKINGILTGVTKKLKDITTTKKKNTTIDQEIQRIETEIKSLDYRINFLSSDIEAISKEKNELVTPKELGKLKKCVKEADRKVQEQFHKIHIMKLGVSILKDTGAKTSIIKFYLPLINKTINDFLEYFDFNVLFTFDENFDETIRARHIDTFRYGNFSEGERLRIDLALMFTWREIAKKKNSASTNLLFFDEILDSGMDSAGLDNFMRVIDEFDPDANLYIISHREGVESGFDHVIRAEKTNNFSSYIFT